MFKRKTISFVPLTTFNWLFYVHNHYCDDTEIQLCYVSNYCYNRSFVKNAQKPLLYIINDVVNIYKALRD